MLCLKQMMYIKNVKSIQLFIFFHRVAVTELPKLIPIQFINKEYALVPQKHIPLPWRGRGGSLNELSNIALF